MSTLRINNIEAQSVPASPTIDEKVKVTNSSGDILVNIDGKTSGITTIGINTTDGNIKFDANSNVLITGILTATTLAGNFTPDSLEVGSNIKLGNAGVITATSFVGSGANLTGITQTTINNNANNRLITGSGTANTLEGESTLTYDGTSFMNTGGTIVAERGNIPSIESKNSTTSSYARVYLSQTSGSGGYFAINKLGTTSTAIGGANATQLWASGNAPMLFATNNAERLRIDSSGNFIVNNTSAAAGGYTYKSLVSDQITSSEQTFGIQYLGAVTYGLNAESNGSFTIKKDGTERVRITSGGKLLVGTSSDYAENVQAAFYGASNGGIALASGTSGQSRLMFADGTSGSGTGAYIGSIIYAHSDNSMRFTTNVSERLRIFSNGSVGVGDYSSTNLGHAFQALRTSGSTYVSSKNTGGNAVFYAEASGGNTAKLELMQAGVGNYTLEVGGTNALMFKDDGTEKLRINSGSVWVNGSTMPTSSSGARLQVGAHTFTGSNHVYHTSRLGIQNNGSLTCISNCSTYTDVTYPGYGFVMVQGASTSDYNTFGICPDSPQTGSDLNFHAGYRKSNIHSDANVRQMWINMSGQVYKRDNGANWNQTSDERLKKNIVDNNIGLAEIKQLRITSFEYRKADEIDMSLFPKANDPLQVIIEGEEGPHTGVIAQEIESVLPECVKTSDKGAKTVQADAITWALVNAVKELSSKNDALEERIKNLEGS